MDFHKPSKPSQALLDHILKNYTYERDKGSVYNTKRGKPGLSPNSDGYLVLYITLNDQKKLLKTHHLVWFFEYGEWPSSCMDHIDGDKLNNHYTNLRLVSNRENVQSHYKSRAGTSDYMGVSWYGRTNKWRTQSYFEGKNNLIGYFSCEIEAARAYDKAMVRIGEPPVNAAIIKQKGANND